MSGFFSGSSSRRRYPNPNQRGSHYRKKGLLGGILGSFSGSGSGYDRHYQNGWQQGYPGSGYPQNHGAGQSPQTVCPKCGTPVPAGSKFCLSCGEKLQSAGGGFCPNCGQPVQAGARFCPGCGTPLQ